MRLSYSKLNTFRQCPLKYRFTYLDRLPRRPRRLFKAGRRLHHALMRWLTYSKAGTPQWDQVEAAYLAAWGSPDDPELLQSRDYQEGLDILREYHDANLERPCQPVFLEHKFSVPLGPHVLVGAVDRVDATDTGYEVIDYKLDRDLRTQGEVDNDLQLGLYHMAIEEAHGVRPEALSLYFLRHNVQRTTVRTAEQSRELKRWVVSTGNDIVGERRWEPCPGDYCGGCDFKNSCPAHTNRPLPPPAALRVVQTDTQLSLLLPDGSSLPPRSTPAPVVAAVEEGQLALPMG